MALTAFPEPKDLEVDFVSRTGDSRPISFQKWDVSNPHPGYGKDPNILNEYGHTKYPMYVGSVIVQNEDEERAARGEPPLPKAEPVATAVPQVYWRAAQELREDGPTVEEWMAAGFAAKDYPPKGFKAISTDEEIAAAKDAEEAAIDASASHGWGAIDAEQR